LILIQFLWIEQAYKLSENNFNHKVGMALHESIKRLADNEHSCRQINHYINKENFNKADTEILEREIDRLEDIIKEKFKEYDIKSPFTIELRTCADKQEKKTCFYYSLKNALSNDKAILNVYFETKSNDIIKNMLNIFICSILLIVVIAWVFRNNLKSLKKERKILKRTKELVNNITHEFKTPVATVMLAGKMINKDNIIEDKTKLKYYSGLILKENKNLLDNINQLLSFASLDRGELVLNIENFDFSNLVEDCVGSFKLLADEKNIKISIISFPENIKINADHDLMKNVICNLIDNAIKYSDYETEINIRIYLTVKELIFKISDRGIGISKENLQNIFESYYRVSVGDIHDVKGFGIGLTYSKQIINAHKGDIKVMSKLNKGSTFIVKLPLLS
jgi:two-component system phosphate regulon sensor histidine kinase PhoR